MLLFHKTRKVYSIKFQYIIGLMCIASSIFLYQFIYNTCYTPLIVERAKLKANSVAQQAINQAVQKRISELNLSSDKFTEITRKEDGTVSTISINSFNVNLFKAGISEYILKELDAFKRQDIIVSPFAFYGYTAFCSFKTTVIVIPTEILSCDIRSNFVSAGINQTKHSIDIEIEISVKLLLPVSSETMKIKATVPVAQTVIVGIVPDTYTNVEGVGETMSDTILNLAN